MPEPLLMKRAGLWTACAIAASATAAEAQAPTGLVPIRTGTAIVQTLSTPTAERESVHLVTAASDSGLHFEWRYDEVHDGGGKLSGVFRYFEARADVDTAGRLRFFHEPNAPEAHPGYTMHALSRAIYREVRAGRRDSMQVMNLDIPPGSSLMQAFGMGGGRATPVRWRGTIAPVSPGTVPFPVLLNGRRVQLAALHLRGDFTARQGRWQPELWVLADSTYPLILKWIRAYHETGNVLQTTRIDLPAKGAGTEGSLPGGGALEGELIASCRVELPGIYFAFNSAHLAPESDGAIAEIAGILTRHPGWTATLEGHTDSIGSATANKALSERRVTAVRARLVEQYKVNVARLRVAGYGALRPRETNTTIEGRARNRRVELVRDCASGKEQ